MCGVSLIARLSLMQRPGLWIANLDLGVGGCCDTLGFDLGVGGCRETYGMDLGVVNSVCRLVERKRAKVSGMRVQHETLDFS